MPTVNPSLGTVASLAFFDEVHAQIGPELRPQVIAAGANLKTVTCEHCLYVTGGYLQGLYVAAHQLGRIDRPTLRRVQAAVVEAVDVRVDQVRGVANPSHHASGKLH